MVVSVLGLFVAALLLLAWSVPEQWFGPLMIALLTVPVFVIVYLGLVIASNEGRVRGAFADPWARMVVIVAIAIVTLVWLDVPHRVRFELSRGALEALAIQMSGTDAPERLPDQWIGWCDAVDIERIDGGVRFLVDGAGFVDRAGLAYAGDGGEPPRIGDDSYRPLADGWWSWISGF